MDQFQTGADRCRHASSVSVGLMRRSHANCLSDPAAGQIKAKARVASRRRPQLSEDHGNGDSAGPWNRSPAQLWCSSLNNFPRKDAKKCQAKRRRTRNAHKPNSGLRAIHQQLTNTACSSREVSVVYYCGSTSGATYQGICTPDSCVYTNHIIQ